jgi:hypothetical protein
LAIGRVSSIAATSVEAASKDLTVGHSQQLNGYRHRLPVADRRFLKLLDPSRLAGGKANGYSTLRAHVHAWHVDEVQRTGGMLLIMALDRLLQLCQRAHAGLSFELLLAFPAGKQEFAFHVGG